MNTIEIEELYKIYSGYVETVALENFSNSIEENSIVGLSGPSGSGKSTLINILGGVVRPTSGRVLVKGDDITKFSDTQLVDYRRDRVGLIYQDFNLIDEFTVYENIALPMLIAERSQSQIADRVKILLKQLDIDRYEKTYPPYISGGERQRVAIAVALANDPSIILADEPTGNLDKEASDNVLELLVSESKKLGKTLIIATHDPHVIEMCDHVINVSKNR